jgi:hypothetical protein
MQLGKPTLSPHALDPQVICLNIPLTRASFHLELEAQEVGPYSSHLMPVHIQRAYISKDKFF